MTQLRIPAVYMRGGTSKGVFFRADALPSDPRARDRLLLRVIGSPDPYGKQIDGMGGATSSTSKVALVSKSARPGCDVDYLFGAVPVDGARIDWSGNCGNLSAAVAPFAIGEGLADGVRDGIAAVSIWQANIGRRIIAHVPMRAGEVVEDGDFELDGVTFPGAEIKLEFLDPAGAADGAQGGAMFPTGHAIDTLAIPGAGAFEVSYINAGNPAIFIDARALGLSGGELQADINGDQALLDLCETIRAHGAVAMGLAATPAEATRLRPHTPKLAFCAPPLDYVCSSGKPVRKEQIDLTTRIVSMGKLHHAMTGTGAVAFAVAAVIPGTLVQRLLGPHAGAGAGAGVGVDAGAGAGAGSGADNDVQIRLGHPSGTLNVGAQAIQSDGQWRVAKVTMSRSARRLMEGWVRIPRAVPD